MFRSKKSVYNALAAISLTLSNGLLGLVVTQLVIKKYGSDFNGLNSTATQLVNMMLILEGGFTVATNVALFEPYVTNDFDSIHHIITATKKKFERIGFLLFAIGIIVSVIYSFLVKSTLNIFFIFSVLFMTVLPTAINLFYTMKFRIMIQVEQKEYIISLVSLITISLSHIVNILLILSIGKMWEVRFVTMLFALANSLIIGSYCKKKYPMYDFSVAPNEVAIKGTKDVFIQKMTSAIYSTLPIIFISTFGGGTLLASVYAVYNSIFVLLKSLLYAITDAPKLGLGQVIAEKNTGKTYKIFRQYEILVFIILFILLSTTTALIMPFISLYTVDISDTDYKNIIISLFLIIITFLEIIHIPSGHIINMSGNFSISKKFQLIACTILVFTMLVGGYYFSIYGILASVTLTALILAILEICYTHCQYFNQNLFLFWRNILLNGIIAIGITFLEIQYITPYISSYTTFMMCGGIVVAINAGILITFNYFINKSDMYEILLYLKKILLKSR